MRTRSKLAAATAAVAGLGLDRVLRFDGGQAEPTAEQCSRLVAS